MTKAVAKQEVIPNKPKRPIPEKDKRTGRFVTGNIGGGRYKGSRNKLGEAFIDDLYADWDQHGKATIEKVRTERPHEYLKVVASLLPKQLDVKVDKYDEYTDEELAALAADLTRKLAPIIEGVAVGSGRTDEARAAEGAEGRDVRPAEVPPALGARDL